MKLSFEDVEFKNFFQYGKIPQKVEFLNGVNLILGIDESRDRSNAAGKSSFFETIPFALFGKTNRNVKKNQIINWKNKKNCEVILNFTKGNIKYSILRSIKPDKLEIYENGTLIPPPSDVRVYQKTLENDILNMDFNSSMPLLYINLNSFIPIFEMDKPQKRKFLERVFNLGMFSKLIDKSNSKLKSTNENLYKVGINKDQNNNTINEIIKQNESLEIKLKNISSSQDEISKLENNIDNTDYDTQLQDLKIKKTEILENLQDIKDKINALDTSLAVKNKDSQNIKISMNEYKIDEDVLKELIIKRNELDNLNNGEDIESNINFCEKDIFVIEDNIKNLRDKNESIIIDISGLKTTLNSTKERYDKLKDNDECPLCGSSLKADIDILKTLKDECMIAEKDIKKLMLNKISINTKTGSLSKDKLTLTDKIKNLNNKAIKISKITLEIKDLESRVGDKDKYNNFKNEYIKLSDIIREIISKKKDFNKIILKQESIISELKENILSSKSKINQQLEIKKKIEILNERVKQENTIRNELFLLIEDNKNKIDKLTKSNITYVSKINKLNELIDYMEFTKILCKDENVKQHAIKTKIPYINKQTNHYLSESGMNFYVKISNWLEEEILGPGISNCSYGNLSGGESKSIDLSLQFSFLDISRLQKGIYPDLLLLDELLDSSVDAMGLKNILNIVKTRQGEDNSKVYLITHRQEIEDVNVDNIYLVSKKDGFSYIQLQD